MGVPTDIAALALRLAPDAHVVVQVAQLAPAEPEPWSTFELHAADAHTRGPRDSRGDVEVRVGRSTDEGVVVVIDGLYVGDRALELSCGTWPVSSGERLRLSDVLGPAQAEARLAALTSVPALSDRWYELGLHEIDRVSWPGPDTENFLLDSDGGVILCLPIVVGPGGDTLLWHL